MIEVEQEYRRELGKLTGRQRVALSAGMLAEVCAMLRKRIELAEPHLSEQEVRLRIAETLYRTDRDAQRLLSSLEA